MSDAPQPIQQAAIQQALTDNNNNQDEASWSLYDYGSMYVNEEFINRDKIVNGDLTSISLYSSPRGDSDYTDHDWKRIGMAMGECIKLKKLDLGSIKLTKQVAKYLFENRGPQTWPDLDVFKMSSGVREIRALLPTLKSFTSLDTLDLSQCRGLGIQAAKLVGGLLNQTRISNLDLDGGHYRSNNQNLKDDGLKCILDASNAKHLVKLSIGGGYSQAGYDALASFLKDAKHLEVLDVSISGTCKPWETDGMRTEDLQCMFIESIQTPSKLELLTLRDNYSTPKDIVIEKLLKLVCNTETIQSVIDSNHKFHAIAYGWTNGLSRDDSEELSHAFEINMETLSSAESTARAVRRKVRSFYFQQPEFDVTSFVDMDANLLPYVIDLVTRIECRDVNWLESRWSKKKEPFLVPSYNNLNGIYRLVKNCPVALFSFSSPHDLLKQKDNTILQLKAEIEEQRLRMEEQAKEIELLKKGGPTPSNKRAKTGDDKATANVASGDIESRFAALEADVALLKKNMKQS